MITKDSDFTLDLSCQLSDGKRYAFVFIALFIFLLIIYGNSFYGEWHLDDTGNILENTNVHLKNLSWPEIKGTFYLQGRISRPVSYFSFALNHYFGGLNVFGYHLVNLAIHYISAIFLFLFIYNTLRLSILRERYEERAYSIALLSTFLWVVNPVQVLAVSYIVQRMASMAGMFYIIAMYFYLKGRTSDDLWKGIAFFVVCTLSALLSIGCKQNAAMLPVSLFFYDLFFIQGVTEESIIKNLKVVVIPILMLLALGAFHTDMSSILTGYSNRPFTLAERLLTEPRVIVFYISLLLYPIHSRFALIHDIDISRTLFDPWTTLPAILLIVFINVYAIFAIRKRPLISFCIIFFFLNHLIEGSIIPLELIYEHRNYIPSMFFFVPVAILMLKVLDYLSYKRSIQLIVVLGIAFLLYDQGHTVHTRNEILKTDLNLWTDNVNKYPNLSRPHNNLGNVYFKKGLLFEAFAEFNKASQLNRHPNLKIAAICEHNLGQIYRIAGKYDKAIAKFKKALSIHPRYTPSLHSLGMIYLKKGNTKKAYSYAMKALGINHDSAELHELLSLALLKFDRLNAAMIESQKALNLDPERTIPLAVIAEVFRKKGETGKAIQYWETFSKNNPKSVEAHCALIELYSEAGKNNLLTEMIGQLLNLQGEKDIRHFIDDTTHRAPVPVYIPDTEKIVSIISDHTPVKHGSI
jgi:tetratricopeptide (TPR) repeat protein